MIKHEGNYNFKKFLLPKTLISRKMIKENLMKDQWLKSSHDRQKGKGKERPKDGHNP